MGESSSSPGKSGFLAGLGLAGGLTLFPIIVIVVVLVSCCICCIVLTAVSSTNKSSTQIQTENRPVSGTTNSGDQQNTIKEGDVLSGIGRIEIETKYNEQKKLSDVKANNYVDSIKGQKVTWVGKVSKIDNAVLDSGYEVYIDMNGYTTIIKDPSKKYGDLNVGQLIKVSGSIDSVFDFVGLTVYLKDTTIEVLK